MASSISGQLFTAGFMESPAGADMTVDGSLGPVRFDYLFSNQTGEFVVFVAKIIMHGGALNNPAHFGGLGNPLNNGLIVAELNPDDSLRPIFPPIKSNDDMHLFSVETGIIDYRGNTRDVLYFTIFTQMPASFGLTQTKGLSIVVQDNLTGMDYMRGFVRGYSVPA